MTTVSQIIGQARYNAGSVAPSGGGNPAYGSPANDGYSSFGGSLLRNTAIGAATGALIGAPTGIGIPIGAGIGAAVGAGSSLIRQPRVAGAIGNGMKAAMAGAAGGALVGTVTPLGPIGGAVAGAAGGFLVGTTSGLLKGLAGGRFSVENETTVWGRIKKGFTMGAVSGLALGAGAGLMFAAIPGGPVVSALIGAAVGGVGGAIHGATTGVTDAATGAKGVTFTGSGGFHLPSLGHRGSGSGSNGGVTQYPGQYPGQSVTQCAPAA